MKRLFIVAIGLVYLALAPPAEAQVYGIWFKTPKAEKKFKKHLTPINGKQMLVCEPLQGIVLNRDTGQINYDQDNNTVYIARSDDPTYVPYVIEDGQKQPNGSKSTLRVGGKYIAGVTILMPRQSLLGLSREYKLRRASLDALIAERDAFKKGSRDWMAQQVRVLGSYEKLSSWLSRTTYTVAATKLQKEIAKQRKLGKGEAIEARLERALASIELKDAPPELLEASKQISGGKTEFAMAVSEHVRIIYDRAGVEGDQAEELLHFAETAIDGFRRDFVDPYLAPDFPDHIPDRPFVEFWFGPDDLTQHQKFYTDYYGLKWGGDLDRRLAVRGVTKRRDSAPEYLDYGKREDHDLMGVVAHRIGHVLAALHFNANAKEMKQDWLEEAVGYHVAFEYFGRNDETCYAFKGAGDDYAGRRAPGGNEEHVLMLGERYMYNQLALEKGRRIDSLAPMNIYSMGDADLAKAWSFFDYIAHEEGETAQRWLRDVCELARSNPAKFIPTWRANSAKLWQLGEGEVFKTIDDRWRTYAESQQQEGL